MVNIPNSSPNKIPSNFAILVDGNLRSGLSILLAAAPLLPMINTATADSPLGWIHSGDPSAYTIDKYSFELSGAILKVNETIDFLNFREDLLAGQQKLIGDSGDLDGERLEVHFGITDDLALFYTNQQQEFAIDLGPLSSVKLVDISKSLNTDMETAGLKWIFWRGGLLNSDNKFSAAALEISRSSNKTADFDLTVSEITTNGLTISFLNNATFSVADLQDESWKSRLIYTWPFPVLANSTATVWGGYGESDATAGSTSDIVSVTIKNFFEQQFKTSEEYYFAGANLNWALAPRLALALSYEYIHINATEFTRNPDPPRNGLPGFLTQPPLAISGNHTFSGSLAYWLSPRLNLRLSGNYYSNQYAGILPHFNNPLSASFANEPYGFIGLQLGIKF